MTTEDGYGGEDECTATTTAKMVDGNYDGEGEYGGEYGGEVLTAKMRRRRWARDTCNNSCRS